MKKLMIIAVLLLTCVLQQGCQMDFQGPSMSAKVFYRDENSGDIYKSRGSGMSGGNAYNSNGGRMTSTGDGGTVYSHGNKTDRALSAWKAKYIDRTDK
jgi:hypothetical protein